MSDVINTFTFDPPSLDDSDIDDVCIWLLRVMLENTLVNGVTASGAILLDSDGQGYRIEVGTEGMARLAHLCELFKAGHRRPHTR